MKLGKINIHSIGISGFTSELQHIPSPPKQLYCIGTLPAARQPTVAIVGSRKPTAYGVEVTHRLAYDLAQRGVVIVSGLAFGVDAIAHKAALEAGGTTIAVMAGGLHRVYPTAHTNLAQQIITQEGALISEYEAGVEAHRYHFLARNRLISGLADAIIVTEATERSGTTSTVAHALEQGKDVFAVPGPVTSLLSAGPNRVLQQGAHVALTADDVLSIIAPHLLQAQQKEQTSLALGSTPLEQDIIALLQQGIQNTDTLQARINAAPSKLLQALTILELNGVIYATGAQTWGLR